MKLSKNFDSSELACKGTNCCGNSFPVSNGLIQGLQDLRDRLGVSIEITSGFRCKTHNSRTPNSATNSYHTRGVAADIKVKGMTPREVYNIAKDIPSLANASFGIYNTFLHIGVDGRAKRW